MEFLTDWLTDWLKELLIEGIMGTLTGLFDTVNSRVREIAVQVGTTPAAWNAGVFSLIRQLSEAVILPIAGLILTFVATYELIQLIIEKNNLHDLDYVGKYTNKPPAHEIPEDYLADETFAAILKEAEKYVGYPYVWGGSSPSTSFDCSGFVSYVYNQCGWDFGRLGAQGLYNISTRTSSPKPGDLVFFTGTYDTPGISHVGIYVGDGWMLHCGDPISYANLNTSYWQSHFYAYGKLF